MSVTPRLSRKLHETLGDEAAEDLVSWMQERETQHGDLRAEMQLGFAKLDASIVELRETVRADIAEVRQQMEAWGAELRQQMDGRTADLRQEMAQDREASKAAMTDFRLEMAKNRETSQTAMAELRLEMANGRESSQAALADLRHEIAQRASDLIKWSFLFWVGAVGAIAALAGVLR